jgi:hypothetical protein
VKTAKRWCARLYGVARDSSGLLPRSNDNCRASLGWTDQRPVPTRLKQGRARRPSSIYASYWALKAWSTVLLSLAASVTF